MLDTDFLLCPAFDFGHDGDSSVVDADADSVGG